MMRPCSVGLAILLAALGPACVDTTPLNFEAPGDDGGAGDGAALGDAQVASCERCIRGETSPCAPQWATCSAVPRCTELMLCSVPDGCYALPSIEERIGCFGACLEELGVMSAEDPVIIPALEVNRCSAENCLEVCGGMPE